MPPRLLDEPCPVQAASGRVAFGGECIPSDLRGDDGFGFVDTLAEYGGPWSFDSEAMASISNQYAAMPSLHIGWATWCAWRCGRCCAGDGAASPAALSDRHAVLHHRHRQPLLARRRSVGWSALGIGFVPASACTAGTPTASSGGAVDPSVHDRDPTSPSVDTGTASCRSRSARRTTGSVGLRMLLERIDRARRPAGALLRRSSTTSPARSATSSSQAVAENSGHLGSNLGAVELTLALHRVFESPTDAILWDTGHQAYVHKIVTGRQTGSSSCARPAACPAIRAARRARTTSSRTATRPRCSRTPTAWPSPATPATDEHRHIVAVDRRRVDDRRHGLRGAQQHRPLRPPRSSSCSTTTAAATPRRSRTSSANSQSRDRAMADHPSLPRGSPSASRTP